MDEAKGKIKTLSSPSQKYSPYNNMSRQYGTASVSTPALLGRPHLLFVQLVTVSLIILRKLAVKPARLRMGCKCATLYDLEGITSR